MGGWGFFVFLWTKIVRMVSVKRMFSVLSVILWSVSSFAQSDTIHIGQIWSSVPVIGKLADLPFVFDGKSKWCYGTFNFELKYYPWTIDDTAIYVYRVNWIHEKKKHVTYLSDNEGNIRLRYLDFKLARGSFVPNAWLRIILNLDIVGTGNSLICGSIRTKGGVRILLSALTTSGA